MTVRTLVTRSLAYYWRTGLVVAFGLLLATAVITGSLVIGDSVRGSLRDTALSRLGTINHALVSSARYFRAELATEITDAQPEAVGEAVPLLSTSGALRNPKTDVVVPDVSVLGIDADLWDFFEVSPPGLEGRQCALNEALAEALGVSAGDSILLTAHRQSDINLSTLFAKRGTQETAPTLRLTVSSVLPGGGAGDFRLDAQNKTPLNLFMSREWLAQRLDRRGQANVIVAHTSAAEEKALSAGLKESITLSDVGIQLEQHPQSGYLAVTTDATVLNEAQVKAARQAAGGLNASSRTVSLYLAEKIIDTDRPESPMVAYAMVAGMQPLPEFALTKGAPETGNIPDDEVWLNSWAAADLGAEPGDSLKLTYLVPTTAGDYPTETVTLRLGAVIGMEGFGADPAVVPDFPGITEAETVGDWEAPFPVDMGLITERDEAYWHRHRAAPKAFVNPSVVRRMWQSGPEGERADWVTSVLVTPPAGVSVAAFAGEYRTALLDELPPSVSGLAFRPVRQMALEASQGTSDFSQLFLGLSMFLVLSGAGLGGMLLRLLAQRRSQQAGIMQAVGYPAPLVGRALVIEGLVMTVSATTLGVPAGMGYAAGIIRALNNWWSGALGRTGALWFHWTPASLIIGAISGLAIGTAVVIWSARQLGQSRALELLRGTGRTQTVPTAGSQKLTAWSLGILLAVAAALAVLSTAWQTIPPQIAFFGIGFALLLAALSASKLALSGALQSTGANRSILRLSLRNAAANSGRSLLVIGLIAAATFTIVAVAANSQDLSALDVTEKDSGTGGFELQATCSVPLPYDPQTEAGRRRLGFSAADEKVMQECEIVSFRQSPGEDISCLNIARPQHPLVLGVPQKMIQRGGFSPTTTSDSAEGWKALQADTPGVIPAFGDAASVRWTLHSGLGEYYSMPGPGGQELPFRFVGLLANSIFQSELLVDEAIFEAIYPSITAPAYFLIDTPPGRQEEVARILRRNLGEMGFQVRTTTAVLNDYLQVQNTYLSMFLALGGLGLLLGTVGLVTVLLRSALERRSELALMLATGFNRAGIAWTLVVENGGLLVVGLVMGTVSALIAVAPQLASATSEVNWWVLSGVLSAILAVGMISCGAAAYAVVRGPLIPALREE